MAKRKVFLALVISAVILPTSVRTLVANEPPQGKLPADHTPSAKAPPVIALPKAQRAELEKLGKAIFFDKNLSNPPGVSCASCHDPQCGYAGSNNSQTNASIGIAPGAISGRFENRNPPTITYVQFCPGGTPTYDKTLQSYVGGFFRDGRASDLLQQIRSPLFHPNEMNNVVGNASSPKLVVKKVQAASYAKSFERVFGPDVFNLPAQKILDLVAQALAAFEFSSEVSPFSSKYDAYLSGKVQLSPSELNGLRLVTGSVTGRAGGDLYKGGQCVICHAIQDDPKKGPDLWTQFCYVNIGVPRNEKNPYYGETDKRANPLGYNPLGAAYVDLGLGDCLYPLQGLPAGNLGPSSNGKGDFLHVNGTFKVTTLRNIDRRPNSKFIKAYMHNGVFKGLKEIVHFYNTRNLTSRGGEVIDFTRPNPYEGLKGKPLWPKPEYASPDTLQNAEGLPGRIGNLGLTEADENDIVAFLKTLSDGYSVPAAKAAKSAGR